MNHTVELVHACFMAIQTANGHECWKKNIQNFAKNEALWVVLIFTRDPSAP